MLLFQEKMLYLQWIYHNTTANESIWEAEFAGDYTSEVRAEGRIGNLIGIKCPEPESRSAPARSSKPASVGYRRCRAVRKAVRGREWPAG